MFAVIRTRSSVGLNPKIRSTLEKLMLLKPNQLVLIAETDSAKKMLKKAEPMITWGEINQKTLEKLLEKRARISGQKKVTKEILKEKKINSFKELSEKILKENKKLSEFELKPVLRLSPPSKGYEKGGIKKSYSVGGVWGYRAQDINSLVKRMM